MIIVFPYTIMNAALKKGKTMDLIHNDVTCIFDYKNGGDSCESLYME